MKVLVIDVGGTFIKHGLMDEDGMIYQQDKVQTPRTSQIDFLECIQQIAEEYETFEGIAMSLPGTIDADTGFVYQGGSLKYNSKSNLLEQLQQRFHCPVEIENDAHCAALCEQWKGNLQGVEHALVLTFGTGIGGCIICNGKPYKGSNLFAGEVSVLLTKDITQFDQSAIWGPQGSVVQLVKNICLKKQIELVDGKQVFAWIEEKDEIAVSAFQAYCQGIARQLFNFQVILDPGRVCIGGGASCNPIFVEGIKKAMEVFYDTIPVEIPRLDIMPCKYHNNSNLIGALRHYLIKSRER